MPSAEALIKIHENKGVNIQWLLTGFGEPYISEVEASEIAAPVEEIEETPATPAPRVRETPGEMVIHIPAFEIRVTHTGGSDPSPASVKKVLVPLIQAAMSKEE
jgi:phage repressor protein C with HTH and peptisase S24 domain